MTMSHVAPIRVSEAKMPGGVLMLTASRTWIAIAIIAAAHDVIKHDDQLTDMMRWLTKKHPVIMRLALYSMAAHLSSDLPRYLDPISGLGWIASHARA